jgi:DNA-binding NarL/FixJ family response regulator
MSTHNDVTASGKIRILIVDDHEAIRSALTTLLSEEPDMTVVAAVETAGEALRVMQCHAIDLAIVDITLGGTNGLDLTRQLHAEHPHLRVVILSMHDASIYGARAERAGASGYVAKQEAAERLVPVIRQAIGRGTDTDTGNGPQ